MHVIEDGRERAIPVKEGEVFLLPKGVYHSPRRPAGTLVGEFNADLALRTCGRCGAVLADPTRPA